MGAWRKSAGVRGGAVDTVIGPQCVVRGRLEGSGMLRVEGRLEGEIATEGDVIIGAEGVVVADVRGRDVLVAGRVEGDVQATGKLEILSSGQVTGDIRSRQLVISEGAAFVGRCDTDDAAGHAVQPEVVPVEGEAQAARGRLAPGVPRAARDGTAPVQAVVAVDRARDARRADAAGGSTDLRARLRAVGAVASSRGEG